MCHRARMQIHSSNTTLDITNYLKIFEIMHFAISISEYIIYLCSLSFFFISASSILLDKHECPHIFLLCSSSLSFSLMSSLLFWKTLHLFRYVAREQIVESRRVRDLSGSVKFHVYQALSSDVMQK